MLTIVSERGVGSGRGRALGNFNAWRSVGFAAGQFFAGLSLVALTYMEIYFVLGAVNLAATAVTLLVTDLVEKDDQSLRLSTIRSELMTRLYPATGENTNLKSNGLHWVYIAVVLQSVTFFGLLSLLPVYLTAEVDISEALMGVFLAINPLSRVGLMVAFGVAVERFGRRSVLGFGMFGTGLFAVIMTGATVPGSLFVRQLVAGVGFVVIAASFSAVVISSQAFIGDIAPVGALR